MTSRVGIIGYGGFGRFLHKAWSEVYGVEVTAVAENYAQDETLGPGQTTNYV